MSGESHGIPDSTLLSVANYTLNDEAGRVERLEGIETKFYSLKKYNVIASAFVFVTEVVRGKTEVFSFILVMPYSEMSEYLSRHSLCETRVQRLLQSYFIGPLKDMVSTIATGISTTVRPSLLSMIINPTTLMTLCM